MARLTARILKLERLLPTGLEAELEGLTDEEIDAQLAELSDVSVEELRAMTPEEQQRRNDETLAALSEAEVLDLMRQAPRLFHDLLEEWREVQRKSTASPPLGQTAGCTEDRAPVRLAKEAKRGRR